MEINQRFVGRVAMVTGASSGIGAAIARSLAAGGVEVAAIARRADRLEALRAEAGERIHPLAADLRDEASLLSAFAAVRDRWGGVDVVVNNAGLGHHAPLASGDTEHWREMLEVNVLALCVATREAITDFRAHGRGGYVIHISSMAGHRIPEESGVYSATKFAVRSLTEGLRRELLDLEVPVRVTAISPGFVETEFAARYHRSEEMAARTYGRYPVLQPDDIARAVVFLLSQPEHVQYHDLLVRPSQQPT
jgi:NADP-dependent 3-hydroxy acid dehydrogenase YdfG